MTHRSCRGGMRQNNKRQFKERVVCIGKAMVCVCVRATFVIGLSLLCYDLWCVCVALAPTTTCRGWACGRINNARDSHQVQEHEGVLGGYSSPKDNAMEYCRLCGRPPHPRAWFVRGPSVLCGLGNYQHHGNTNNSESGIMPLQLPLSTMTVVLQRFNKWLLSIIQIVKEARGKNLFFRYSISDHFHQFASSGSELKTEPIPS